MKNFILTFVASQVFFAAVAWVGGYDFDYRDHDVAIFTLLAVVFGGLFAWTVVSTAESNEQEKLLNEKEKLLIEKEKLIIARLKKQP